MRRGLATWHPSIAGDDVRMVCGTGAVTEELVGRPLDVVLRERWADVRRVWSQTTFYLFDPDSWR